MLASSSFHVTGIPALLIILVILAVLITGCVVTVKALGRGARKAVNAERDHHSGA
jgi:hypothetical protein